MFEVFIDRVCKNEPTWFVQNKTDTDKYPAIAHINTPAAFYEERKNPRQTEKGKQRSREAEEAWALT